MEDWQLPVELEDLERALVGRPLPRPSAHLREKVLGDLRRRCVPAEGRQAAWRFAVVTVAGALLWLNLSLAATRNTDCGLRPDDLGQSLETACRQIEQLVPDLPPRELRRQAILLRAGSALVPCPSLAFSGDAANLVHPFVLGERLEERSK